MYVSTHKKISEGRKRPRLEKKECNKKTEKNEIEKEIEAI